MDDDMTFGKQSEESSIKTISKFLGFKLKHTKSNTAKFDFKNRRHKVFVELKTRRHNSSRYPTHMVGYNKIKFAFEILDSYGIIAYICFRFLTDTSDEMFIWKISRDNFKEKWIKYNHTTRRDRGRNEVSDACFIPISAMTRVY